MRDGGPAVSESIESGMYQVHDVVILYYVVYCMYERLNL